MSLISEGNGYWKYVPEDGGVRFLTGSNYDTRFGDSVAFSTASSFGR